MIGWPAPVPGHVLHHHLAGALDDGAVHLPVEQKRIEHPAHVVDDGVPRVSVAAPVSGSISTSQA